MDDSSYYVPNIGFVTSGAVALRNGIFSYSGATAATLAKNLAIDMSGSLRTIGDLTLSGVISETSALSQLEVGLNFQRFVLTGVNTYTGRTFINGIASVSTLPNGGVAGPLGKSTSAPANLVISDGGVLQYTGATAVTDRGFTVDSFSGTVEVTNAATSLTFTGQVTGTSKLVKTGPGTLTLTNTSNNYTAGTNIDGGTLQISADGNLGQASGQIAMNGGTLKTTAAVTSNRKISLSGSGETIDSNGFNSSFGDVDPGNFTKNGTGKVSVRSLVANGVTINAGTLAIKNRATTGGNKPARMTTLSVNPAAALDLNDNDLVVNNGVFSDVQALVFGGYRASTDPAATGIISTTGQAAGGVTILSLFNNALLSAADYPFGSGQTISAGAIVGKYTYIGDCDWDGQVTPADYTAIDSNLGTTGLDPGQAWFYGDTDFDGNITPADYTGIDSSLGLGIGNPLAMHAMGSVAVPEVGSAVGLLGIAQWVGMRRRRRVV